MPLAGAVACREEKLTVDGKTIGAGKDHLLGNHQIIGGEMGPSVSGKESLPFPRWEEDLGPGRGRGPRGKECNGSVFIGRNGGPLDSFTRGEELWGSTGHRDPPEVLAVDVFVVRGIENRLPPRRPWKHAEPQRLQV